MSNNRVILSERRCSQTTSSRTRGHITPKHYANDAAQEAVSPSWRNLSLRVVLIQVVIFLVVLLGIGHLILRLASINQQDLRGKLESVEIIHEDLTKGNYLKEALAKFPPLQPERKRIIIFGNSQIRAIKQVDGSSSGSSDDAEKSKALLEYLTEMLPDVDVCDISADGQVAVELLLMAPIVTDRLRPDIVIIPYSLLMTTELTIRDGYLNLASSETWQYLQECCQDNALTELWSALQPFAANQTKEVFTGGDGYTYFFEPLENFFSGTLADVFPMAQRGPVLRNLIRSNSIKSAKSLINQLLGRKTAKTVGIGKAYKASMQALRLTLYEMDLRHIKVILYEQPVNQDDELPQFDKQAFIRYQQELTAMAADFAVPYLDLSDIVPGEYYGFYEDGSGDRAHFTHEGHLRVARALLPTLQSILGNER